MGQTELTRDFYAPINPAQPIGRAPTSSNDDNFWGGFVVSGGNSWQMKRDGTVVNLAAGMATRQAPDAIGNQITELTFTYATNDDICAVARGLAYGANPSGFVARRAFTSLYVGRYDGGGYTPGSNAPVSLTNGVAYRLFVHASGAAASVTVTAEITTDADPTTVLATTSYTDTANVIVATGTEGMHTENGFAGSVSRVRSFIRGTGFSTGWIDLQLGGLSTSGSIKLECTRPYGGTGPYTHQWYRSTTADFTPGAGNILAGKTSLLLTDATAVAGTRYFYKLVTTDTGASNVTATSNEYAVTMPTGGALKIGGMCHSWGIRNPAGANGAGEASNPMDLLPMLLGGAMASAGAAPRPVSVSNQSVSGKSTTDWLPGNALYDNAKVAWIAAGTKLVLIDLLINDASAGTSAATAQSNLQAITSDLVASGISAMIALSPPFKPGTQSGRSAATLALLTTYDAVVRAVVTRPSFLDGTPGVLLGPIGLFSAFTGVVGVFDDCLHPNVPGSLLYSSAWSSSIANAIVTASTGGGGGGGEEGTGV